MATKLFNYYPDSGGAIPLKNNEQKNSTSTTPNEELILLALQDKELYGLQIVQSIKDASGGRKKLRIGSLYPTLHSLEEKGLVQSQWGDECPQERKGARRRYYSLTQSGEATLADIQGFRENLLNWQPV